MKDKLAIFDLDGTLVDTCRANYEAYKYAVDKVIGEWEISLGEFQTKCYGKNYKLFLKETGITDSNAMIDIHKIKSYVYEKMLLEYGKENEFLIDLIQGVQDKYNIAVVTTASRENAMKAISIFLQDINIDFIVSAEDVKKLKPYTEGIELVIRHFKCDTNNVVYFDDSAESIELANRLGITTYCVCL